LFRFSAVYASPTEASSYLNLVDDQKRQQAAQQAYNFQLQQQTLKVKDRYAAGGVPAAVIPSPQVPVKMAQLSERDRYVAAPLKASADDYDPFYSPILKNLDTVFSGMGFADEPCRERLVCSMYKAPSRFSPNSNLVSAELSRSVLV